MERAVLVYTTWPSIVEAERAGRAIVEKRLAACVNILPGMVSHYWWQGKIERAEESGDDRQDPRSTGRARARGGEGDAQLTRRRRSWCCRSKASTRITIAGSSTRRRSEAD